MTMKDVHGLECAQCKIRDQFYEDFNNDSKKNVSYFGVISYINHYLFMPVSSNEANKEFPKSSRSCKGSDVCFLQLVNEWSIRDLIAKEINRDIGPFSKHLKEKKKKSLPKPSFYFPEHTGNLITIKKSESFSESSPDDAVCSEKLEVPKNVYKCKPTKKNSPKQKVAHKEPKLGTLKRKRWNWKKLSQSESYEDDLFEDRKFKRIILEDSNSEEDKIATPRWSVQISPRAQSRSPSYEDCYSPTELQNIRKEAEEYQYRRNKRRRCMRMCKKGDDSAAEMKEDPETYKTLQEVRKKLKKLEKKDCDSEEDYYFTDGEDSEN